MNLDLPSTTGTAESGDEPAARTDAAGADRPGGLVERARAAIPGMSASESRVWQALLDRGVEVVHLTVSEAAKASGSGVGTVIRACQGLGFKGFQDAKIALAHDMVALAEQPLEDVAVGDSPAQVLEKLAASSGAALARTPASVDAGQLEQAVSLLQNARRVLFLAVGTSAPLAQDAAYRLSTIGVAAEAPADVHVQHVHARLLGRQDVVVAVSHTGSTHETVAAVSGARDAGAQVIAVTSFTTTPLTELADVVLVAGGRETAYRVEAMTSRLAHLLVLDGLFVALFLADPQLATDSQELTGSVLAEHRF